MNYWSDLYTEIAEKVKAGLSEIQWIDLWHDQVSYLSSELPFSTPALFIGFSTVAIDDRGLLVQDCDVQVDMYLFYETLSDTYHGSYNKDRALDYLKILTRLHVLFHGRSGDNYSEMRRVDMRREESGNAGNLYRISFQCHITDYSAQVLYEETQDAGRELDITKGGTPDGGNQPPLYDMG